MGGLTVCAYCCAWSSLIGFFFYAILGIMAYNRNEVFLEHKANGVSEEAAQKTQDLMSQLALVRLKNNRLIVSGIPRTFPCYFHFGICFE